MAKYYLVFASLFFCTAHAASAATHISQYGHITEDTTWTAAASPYILPSYFQISNGATLTLEPGTVLQTSGVIFVGGTVNSNGTKEAPVIMTDQYGEWLALSVAGTVNLKHTTLKHAGGYTSSMRGNISSIGGTINLEHVIFEEPVADSVLVNLRSATLTAENTIFQDAEEGIRTNGSSQITVHNSTFKNISGLSISHFIPLGVDPYQIDAKQNYWSDLLGPEKITRTRPNSMLVSNYVDTDPFLIAEPGSGCQTECFSNVLFLPGIKASRLYKQGTLTEKKLWEPTLFDADLSDLAMDEGGTSIQNGVYTRDVVDEAGGIGDNIYKSIIGDFSRLKTSGAINDYSLFAYDWRYDVRDIVNGGTAYQTENKNLVAEVARLAESAKSKKVTIVAHSNGGLLAKALMQKLEATGQAGQVDKIILIGTPQMGTPLATLSFLYGYDEQLLYGTLVSRKDARQFTENLPGAYALLPSQEYFTRGGESIIQFDETNTRYEEYRAEYGDKIQSWAEFVSFLTGAEGRSKPAASDVEKENILNSILLSKAQNTHDALDAWTPPAGVQVVQIAGTGLDTVAGVKYTEKEKATCARIRGINVCRPNGQYEPIYEPVFSKDGDNVVTAPSALMLSTSGSTERYWVDMARFNRGLQLDRKHASLTEMTPVRTFVESLIKNQSAALPDFIATTSPNHGDRLRMRLYSPLDIHLYDTHGNHTGPRSVTIGGVTRDIIEENIPNSYYYQLGERKYVGVPKGEEIRTELRGYGEGSYTLEVDEVTSSPTNEEVVQNITFKNLPTTAETIANLTLPEAGIAALPALTADTNGDGTEDYSLSPVLGEEVTLEEPQDQTPPETVITVTGTAGTNNWYRSAVTVTLSTEESATTEYSLNDATWQSYTAPFIIATEGTTNIAYRSTDAAGNLEQTKSKEIKIDTKAPEATITFDSETEKVTVISKEEAVVVQNQNTFVITDQAENATTLTFAKQKEKKHKDFSVLESIQYNQGTIVSLYKTSLRYFYKENKKKEEAKVFSAQLKTSSNKVIAHYLKKKNQTFIMDKTEPDEADGETADKRKTREILPGLVIPYMVTKEGEIIIKY